MIAATLQSNEKGMEMSKDALSEALRTLIATDAKRSETARLRDVLEDVEAALKAGVSRASVLATLKSDEFKFTMTEKSFESALYRLRKKKASKATPPEEPNQIQNRPAPKQTNEDTVRPPGISDSEWNSMRAKATRENRKNLLNNQE